MSIKSSSSNMFSILGCLLHGIFACKRYIYVISYLCANKVGSFVRIARLLGFDWVRRWIHAREKRNSSPVNYKL